MLQQVLLTTHMPTEEFHISKQVLDRFSVVGINYSKADTATRGLFSLNTEAFTLMANTAKKKGIKSLFVVSTCNRTEIYGIAESVIQLADLLVEHTRGDKQSLFEFGYFKNGDFALDHLFNVAAGLDSQILGDYEILGQIKRAVDVARKHNLIGPVMDRILNFVYQASKKIKTETGLSDGTVSVSFAAIELLRDIPEMRQAKVLVIGAGKFGANVCKNVHTYLPEARVTIINRTDENAKTLAAAANVFFDVYANKQKAIDESNVVVVCTNATEPTIIADHFNGLHKKLVLDLSVPANVHPAVKSIEGIEVVNVDEISTKILDKTLAKRKAEVPKAQAIIEFYKKDLKLWLHDYHYSLHLKTWKNKLREIDKLRANVCEFYKDKELIDETERVIKAQKAVKQLAVNLKIKNDKGCQFINLINDYLQTSY